MDPKEVTVIVHEGKSLLVRKKGKQKYHVVFGIGSSKFKTENQHNDSGNPSWMTESTIELLHSTLPLILVVKDKDEVLGQVSVPLNTLPTARCSHNVVGARLQPHKKCQSPQGSLLYQAWVSKLVPKSSTLYPQDSPKTGTFGKIKDTLSKSPLLGRKLAKEQPLPSDTFGNALPNLRSRRNSRSLSDLSRLHHENPSAPNFLNGTSTFQTRTNSFSDIKLSITPETSPEITAITPSTVSTKSGTKICLQGSNLGNDKNDIIGLFLCGANCLKSLEYVSSNELLCTTKSWKPCTGFVVIETRSGGKGKSTVQLTFKEEPLDGSSSVGFETPGKGSLSVQNSVSPAVSPNVSPVASRKSGFMSRITNSESKDQQAEKIRHLEKCNEELTEQVRHLQQENADLKEQNETMKLYVDNLVARVMEECPDALSSSNNNSRRPSRAKTRTLTV